MKLVFGNLKMNFLYKDFQAYLEQLNSKFEKEAPKTQLGLAIPYIYLKSAADSVGTKIKVLAQDLHSEDSGAFTSSISGSQLTSMNIFATLIGHSECRKLSQNSLVVRNKVEACLRNEMEVIYCCGENPITEIEDELGTLSADDLKKVIIAYEPISSIGTGKPLDAVSADKELQNIRGFVQEKWGPVAAKNIKLLYGGSVNTSNYKDYLDKNNIDGVLVGGASLKVDDLWKMATLK